MFTGPNIVTNGLVLHLDAGNTKSYTSGSTIWYDKSGNRYSGSLINGPTFSSGNGGNIILDGTNDYISISSQFLSNLTDNNSITVSIFVNIDEPTKTGNGGLVCNQRYQSEVDPGGFGLVITSTGNIAVNLTKVIGGTPSGYEVIGGFSMNRQQYSYYTFTYENSTKTIITYKNGIFQNSSTNINYGWTKNTTSRSTYIGANTQGGWGNYYKMNIASTSIYNRALLASEVLQNYNSTKTRFGL